MHSKRENYDPFYYGTSAPFHGSTVHSNVSHLHFEVSDDPVGDGTLSRARCSNDEGADPAAVGRGGRVSPVGRRGARGGRPAPKYAAAEGRPSDQGRQHRDSSRGVERGPVEGEHNERQFHFLTAFFPCALSISTFHLPTYRNEKSSVAGKM